jgi:hypothetical protein
MKIITRSLSLVVLLSAPLCLQASLLDFTTDGCSLFPDGVRGTSWCHCCIEHDLAYWKGGTAIERLAADEALRSCVTTSTGDQILAEAMYQGVRMGGAPYSLTPYRWAYGWTEHRFYQSLTPAELIQANYLQQQYLSKNPNLQCPE